MSKEQLSENTKVDAPEREILGLVSQVHYNNEKLDTIKDRLEGIINRIDGTDAAPVSISDEISGGLLDKFRRGINEYESTIGSIQDLLDRLEQAI